MKREWLDLVKLEEEDDGDDLMVGSLDLQWSKKVIRGREKKEIKKRKKKKGRKENTSEVSLGPFRWKVYGIYSIVHGKLDRDGILKSALN